MPHSVLRKGSKGGEVRQLQEMLAAAGFSPGPIDGDFGPKTGAAVRAFQKAKGIKIDGVVGPQTWGALTAGAPPAAAPAPAGTLAQQFWARYQSGQYQGALPEDAINQIRGELGAQAAYLTIAELAPIIIQAAAEKWAPDKVTARTEATTWWQTHTQNQRQWALSSPADREHLVAQWQVRIVNDLRTLYGPDLLTVTIDSVRADAEAFASGARVYDKYLFEQRSAAEQTEGTPAWNDLLNERRKAGEAAATIENLQAELSQMWREWMGDHLPQPTNLGDWAKDIFENKQTRADFETFIKQSAKEMYATKPENIPYKLWVNQPKQLLAQMFEMDPAAMADGDSLLASYTRGEIASLGDLELAARRDPRHDQTSRARERKTQLGFGVLRRMGFV